jgi:hypothetical protein
MFRVISEERKETKVVYEAAISSRSMINCKLPEISPWRRRKHRRYSSSRISKEHGFFLPRREKVCKQMDLCWPYLKVGAAPSARERTLTNRRGDSDRGLESLGTNAHSEIEDRK